MLSGKSVPSTKIIISILEAFPNINPSWLLLNKGHMLNDAHVDKIDVPSTESITSNSELFALVVKLTDANIALQQEITQLRAASDVAGLNGMLNDIRAEISDLRHVISQLEQDRSKKQAG